MGRPRKYVIGTKKERIVKKQEIAEEIVKEPEKDKHEEFLLGFLSGGPIYRVHVYREATNAGLEWERVREAFARLHGREYVQKGEYFWRIMPE